MREVKIGLLILSMSWLPSCAAVPGSPALAVVVPKAAAIDRRAEIKAALAALCPVPLDNANRLKAADYVTMHPEAFTIVRDLDRLDKESLQCRAK